MRISTLLCGMSIVAAALTSCSPVVSGGPRPGAPGDDARPTPLPRRGNTTGTTTDGSARRYVCRGQHVTGWIAVDYIETTEVCSTGANTNYRFNTAVIVSLTSVAVGQSLEVCADERIPQNWSQVRLVSDAKRCQPERLAEAANGANVREIMRQR